MVFEYPDTPHVRRHGPQGYTDYHSFKPWLRDDFTFRCTFCLTRERWYPNGHAAFSVDHLVPQILAPERICEYDNLVYACSRCNWYKQAARPVLDPCEQAYGEHLRILDDGTIEGLSIEGKKLIAVLRLDHPTLTESRQLILDTLCMTASASVPEARRVQHLLLSFPDDLPDLKTLRPLGGNTRPEGVQESYLALRERGQLPAAY
jgi:hypothetical protein